MNRMILYTTGCPKCKILEKKLVGKKIEFDKCEDKNEMAGLRIVSVPVLGLTDGTLLSFAEAVKYVNAL